MRGYANKVNCSQREVYYYAGDNVTQKNNYPMIIPKHIRLISIRIVKIILKEL